MPEGSVHLWIKKEMQYLIRPFKEIEISRLYAMIRDVYNSSDCMSDSLEEKFPSHESFEEYASVLSVRPGAIALAAELGGELCGYITIVPRYQAKLRHTSELNMGVSYTSRGKGVGKLLLREALRLAEESGVLEIIYLMVRADNIPAIRLYEEMGFDHLAILKNDTKTQELYYDGFLMRKFIKYPPPGLIGKILTVS